MEIIKVAGIVCTLAFVIGLLPASAAVIHEEGVPAFGSDARGSTDLSSITGATFMSSLRLRNAAADGSVPAAVEYQVDIKPAGNATAAFGTITTAFTATIMEANQAIGGMRYFDPADSGWNANYWDDPAVIQYYRDITTAGGQIYRYSKNFKYSSGVAL